MKIEVLGSGCPKCMALEANVRKALEGLSLQADVEKVTEMERIVGHGVMSTPALAIDGRIVLQGKSPTVDQLKDILQGAR
jgi:small redox-active disulfide protein 2